MNSNQIPDLRHYFIDWLDDLGMLRQNHLLDEGSFLSFAKDRGINVGGVVTGEPGIFHEQGWLTSDGDDYDNRPQFHPFRIYPLHQTLQAFREDQKLFDLLVQDREARIMQQERVVWPDTAALDQTAYARNSVADLAILLEPIYWPRITGYSRRPAGVSRQDYQHLEDQYRLKTVELVQTLDVVLWGQTHTSLRVDAANLDQNDQLYLLLRLAKWDQRQKLKGRISGALWLRHIAEVIRRAFEEVHSVQWLEEDQAFGMWHRNGRLWTFGSERPLDDETRSTPYLAWDFGLLTGSIVRWYVEGETEYHAIRQVIPEPAKANIEIVNLRGNMQAERDNVALKLGEWLKEDKAHKRFSMISFDLDVQANVRTIRRQIEQNNIVGFIAAHKPDFEFANFTIQELAEVAARIDEAHGSQGDAIRQSDWSSVKSLMLRREFDGSLRLRFSSGKMRPWISRFLICTPTTSVRRLPDLVVWANNCHRAVPPSGRGPEPR